MIIKKLEKGEYHYKEEYVINRLFEMVSEKKEEEIPGFIKESSKKEIEKASEPIAVEEPEYDEINENLKEIFTGEVNKEKLQEIWKSPFGWYIWGFILYYYGISLSVIGKWLGVNKSTPCRWLDKIALYSKPWIDANNLVKANNVKNIAIDEKWIVINGATWYLFAAVDTDTRYPLHVNFYPSNNINCCKCFLSELKNKGYYPKSIITDGWDAYISSIKDIFPNAEHLLCHFHAVKRLFFRIKSAFHYTQAELLEMAAKLFQSDYKKTVTSRFEKLTQKLRDLGSEQIIKSLKAKMPTLLKSVGSSWRPSTANAAESFFSHFERFYRLKGPFPDEKSARKHLQLFMLGYLFTIGAESQPCPLEKIGYDVVQVPFYHLLNRPDIVALKNRMAS